MERTQKAGAFPIAGLQPTSLIDYPDRVSAVLFTAGCNLRCPFCHNPDLVLPDRVARLTLVETDDVLAMLRERRNFLDGVVITGGEPTLHPGLPGFLRAVKDLGLLVKLDTNGTNPDALFQVFEEGLADFVAMDIKASHASYSRLAGVSVDLAAIDKSIAAIRDHAPAYEFRTTVAPTLEAAEIEAIARWLAGARRYMLQRFRIPPEGLLVDSTWIEQPALSVAELHDLWERIADRFDEGGVRS